MLRSLVAAAAALAILGSSIVYAQQRFGRPGGDGDGGLRFVYRHRLSAEDIAAFTDARIAALKAGLELTSDQAKNWPAFEQALRDLAQLRIARLQAREAAEQQAPTAPPPFARLARRADNLARRGAALKRVAETGAPLYQSLTDAQKRRFRILARLLRPHHHHMHFAKRGDGWGDGLGGWRGEHGFGPGWREGHGFGRDGGHGDHWFGHEGRRFGEDGDNGAPGGSIHEDQGAQL